MGGVAKNSMYISDRYKTLCYLCIHHLIMFIMLITNHLVMDVQAQEQK